MPVPADWTPHRREDGEQVGWIRPAGDDWVAIDVLGREITPPVDWLEAEELLEAHGIRFLGDPWMLERPGEAPLRVRLVEVTPQRIVVKTEDFGAVDAPVTRVELPWPIPERLRPPRPGDPDPTIVF